MVIMASPRSDSISSPKKGGGWKQDYPNAFIPGRALADQPTIFFTTKMPDGYQRALCSSYILDGKCRFEAKGETCLYAQHGGHPQQPSKAMIEAVKKRAEDWTARKGKWNAKNGKSGGAQQKHRENREKTSWPQMTPIGDLDTVAGSSFYVW